MWSSGTSDQMRAMTVATLDPLTCCAAEMPQMPVHHSGNSCCREETKVWRGGVTCPVLVSEPPRRPEYTLSLIGHPSHSTTPAQRNTTKPFPACPAVTSYLSAVVFFFLKHHIQRHAFPLKEEIRCLSSWLLCIIILVGLQFRLQLCSRQNTIHIQTGNGFLYYHLNELPYSPLISHRSLLTAWSQQKNEIKKTTLWCVGCPPQRCLCITCEQKSNFFFFLAKIRVNSSILKSTVSNCREGLSFLAAVSACAGCKRQYGSSSGFSARRAEVWTQCYHDTNVFPALLFYLVIASADLSVPPLFLLAVRSTTLTYVYKYKYVYNYKYVYRYL